MVFSFFRKGPKSGSTGRGRAAPVLTPGTRLYAVGDIHGRADLLNNLHEQIIADAATADSSTRLVVLYLGDYVDRGLESRQVIDLMLEDSFPGFERIFLKGNHEQVMLDFHRDPLDGRAWLQYGGRAALYSYGAGGEAVGESDERLQKLHQWFVKNLPDDHLDFLQNLALYHIEGDYLFVHAGIKPGMAVEKQGEQSLLWIRDEFTNSRKNHSFMVVHGHSITEAPDCRPNRIGVDTGAFRSNILTCLVLEGEEQRFLATEPGVGAAIGAGSGL